MTDVTHDTEPFGDEATTYDLMGGETWRFDDGGPLIATYVGFDRRDTQYGAGRVLHHFVDADGAVHDVWGGTGLDPLLEGHEGHYVRVVRTEDMLTTSRGRRIRIWRVACRDES